jgi:tripartite-type tricarboxylate transporter receptor subunit TctC
VNGWTTRAAQIAAAVTLLHGLPAEAQSPYPTKVIRVVIPFPAGTSPDVVVRVMSPKLTAIWGQQLIVENRTGASGTIGANAVATAAPDGYTYLYSINSIIVGNPHLFSKLSYDALKDFVPVSQVVNLGYALITRPDMPAQTLAQLIAQAKAQPGKLNYASPGAGTGPHIVMEMLKGAAGIDITHVPMNTPGFTAVMTGEVHLNISPITSAAPLIQSGKLRGLGVTMPTRISSVPDVPAIAETLPGFAADAWHGFFAPAGTPSAIVEKFSADVAQVLRDPEVRKRLTDLGLDVIGSTPQAFAATVKADYEKWGAVIRAAKIRLD